MKICIICKRNLSKSSFEKWQHRCKDCENLFTCSKCKIIKHRDEFSKDSSRCSGLSSKCKVCNNSKIKNEKYYSKRRLIDKRRANNSIRKTRQVFRDFVKRLDSSISVWEKLGYSKQDFIDKFQVIEKGMHIDHCIPLSWFIESTPISISCNLHNLQLLKSDVNIRKSNSYADLPSCKNYLEKILPYIKDNYKEKILTLQGGWVG